MRGLINILVIWIPFPKLRRRVRTFLSHIMINYFAERTVRKDFIKNLKLFRKVPGCFEFKRFEKPVVSIIVPVYNQYEYTKKCLWSILQNTNDVEYEVILADDCSTDKTAEIANFIKNIRVIKTPKNMRFLLNCNNAAKYANGKYLVFLNNDTQVMKDWLRPLVNLIESDDNIGLVGVMLLYPDFTLQEAGGIIYPDATGCNYGRNDMPWHSQYNYVKDVDYISGAAIMLRRDTWETLGGFDTQFVPAYYEDTDLAFRIRNDLGMRVVYQPLSRVVHFEGKSNGTDLTSGQKQYQVVNAEKFYNKWKKVLAQDHCWPDDVFLGRDRGKGRKVLLFIDELILTYDNDCGSRASFQYLDFFRRHGLNVKYMCKYRRPRDYHKTTIEQMGIEIVDGDDLFDKHLEEWFVDNGKYVDYVYLNRPDVADWCLDLLRKYTNAKIIFQGHDLHHVRMQRETKFNSSHKLKREVQRMENVEKRILPQMDVVTYFSEKEIELIKDMNLDVRVLDTLPLYMFPRDSGARYDAKARKDIMFIGGYNHTPNVDAATWLLTEIMPLVWEKNKDIKLHLVGSNMPMSVVKLCTGNPNVIVDGFLTDDELNGLYAKVKMSVIPLRFGAGIKGKIIEAIYNKVPVITTSIGAEGIPAGPEFLGVCDDAVGLAEKIVSMYTDNEKLQKISDASSKFIDDNFAENAALNKFKQWMDIN